MCTASLLFFGNPYQIWKKSIETLEKKLLNKIKAWGSHEGQKKVWEIAHILEFLRECEGLANDIPNLESDIYNKETLGRSSMKKNNESISFVHTFSDPPPPPPLKFRPKNNRFGLVGWIIQEPGVRVRRQTNKG